MSEIQHSSRAHARLNASSFHSWMMCPPSVKLSEQFADKPSAYAEEGTFLHELCELKLHRYLGDMAPELIEHRLDYSEYVPDGFDTGDLAMEMTWRRSLSGHYSGKSCFSSRVVCGECGAFYGSKVWHSTDEYRRVIWRCNGKYEGNQKCSTPHVTQNELEKAFVAAMQELIIQKGAVFTACQTAIAKTLDTAELDRTAAKLQDQALGMAERVRKLVEENARVRRDQEEYQLEYNALAAEHEKLSERIRSIAGQKRDKEERRRKIEIFLRMLEEQNEYVRFDPYTFVALVDKTVVGQDGKPEFILRNGMKYVSYKN